MSDPSLRPADELPDPDELGSTGRRERLGSVLVAAGVLTVEELAEALLLQGPNGSGKSTLLRVLAGLLAPAEGTITWDGTDVVRDREAHRARLCYLGHQDALKAILADVHLGRLVDPAEIARLIGHCVENEAINATTLGRVAQQTVEEHNTVGAFLQEELAWQDRLFLTVGVRMDDNSAFGKNFDRVYYPKASLSWIASDESYVNIPFMTTLKLRAAYGESGQAPLPYAADALEPHRFDALDPQAKIPEYKACAVRVTPARREELPDAEAVQLRGRY